MIKNIYFPSIFNNNKIIKTKKNVFGDVEKKNNCKSRSHTNVDDSTMLKRINHDAATVEANIAVTKTKIRSQHTLKSTSILKWVSAILWSFISSLRKIQSEKI